MPTCEITIATQNTGASTATPLANHYIPPLWYLTHSIQEYLTASTTTPLANAWVYILTGSVIVLLRTDGTGRVKSLRSGGDRTKPQDYTQTYTTTVDSQLNLYYSRGAKLIPDSILTGRSAIFYSRRVEQSNAITEGSATATGTPGGGVNTYTVPPLVIRVTLPNILLTLTNPAELSIWPLLWELPNDNFLTLGLNQGGTLWTSTTGSGNLTVTENTPAGSRSAVGTAQVRPNERGLRVVGTIDARATGVRIQILNVSGNAIQLRQNLAATTGVTEITGTLRAASGNTKPFEAAIYFLNSADAFGPVQILVLSDGMTPQIVEAFACHFAGLQIALVNDYLANLNGQNRGSIHTEADEKIVVDFQNSPQATLAAISAQTRARRMVTYQMANRNRSLSATNAAIILKPEMPLWMAEFHIVGISRTQLEDLMARRKRFITSNPTNLQIDLQYRLTLSWDGPDSGTTSTRLYRYSENFTAAQAVAINLNASDQINGVDAQGQITNAFATAPATLTFPVTGRRLPQVVVSGQTRLWGRQSTGTAKDTILIEWQPRIVNTAGNEILRGGDGVLKLESVTIAGMRIDGGLIPSGGGTVPPSASASDIELPRFRVRGFNPPSPANTVIDTLVQDYFDSHNTVPRVTILSLACWQETVRRILAHEAGHQFEHRGTTRRRFGGEYYGHEQDMPIFGPPHGYGYGQHDNPQVTSDGAWSFFENIKESITRIMGDRRDDKAIAAYNLISTNMPTPPNQRIKAVYQREVVRRYNGGSEFHWNGTDWVINPSLPQWASSSDHSQGANPRLPYPNNVLGTGIAYSTGSGAATTFTWPINFTAANYGPGT